MKEYETIADLTSSKQSSTGLLLWCRENLLYYIVQADGYTATGDDITFSNGRIGKAIDIADASQIKTITGNVQDDLSSIISGGLPSQVGQAGEYLRTDGTNAYWDSVVGLGAIGKTPEEYGAVGDGVTDDTAALQAAIDAIKGSGALGLPTNYLVLEAKTYAHTGLVIDRAINIIGKDRNASRLKCLTTSSAAISVSLEYDTTNYQTAGRPGPTVAIKDCIIESDKGFAATNYGIRAFDATTNHIRGWIYLDGVDIHSMGGDALFANTWEGALKAVNCKFINNAGKQINATSCADWQFVGCEFGVTPDDNILLSGCAAFTFTTCNIYSSTGDLVTLFTDAAATAPVNHQFVSCSFDRSSMGHGVVYNVRNDGNVTFTNCYWTYNGQGAPETYSDIWIDASVGRGPTIVGGWMQDPSISDSLYNIFFNGTSSSCYTTGVQFEGGNARSTNVTNSIPQLKFEGAENFDTFTDLEASTWPEIGDEVKVVSGANAPFIIKDAGSYTALAGDRTLANGRVGALQIDGEANALWFATFQDANDRVNLNGGGIVNVPAGTHETQFTIDEGVSFEGEGVDATILKLANGANGDVITSRGFATLTGSNTWLNSQGVPVGFGVKHLAIDGNKANNTLGSGLKFYGKKFYVEDVYIFDCAEDGFYSEGADVGGQLSRKDAPECQIHNVWIRNCGGNGLTYRGPHDGVIGNLFPFLCGGTGASFEYSQDAYDGAGDIGFIHSYANDIGVSNNSRNNFEYIQTESNYKQGYICNHPDTTITQLRAFKNWRDYEGLTAPVTSKCIDISVACKIGLAKIRTDHGGVGLSITGTGTHVTYAEIDGEEKGSVGVDVDANLVDGTFRVYDFTIGEGVSFSTTSANFGCNIDFYARNCATHFNNVNTGQGNFLKCEVFTQAGETAFAGDPPNVNEYFQLISRGDTAKRYKSKDVAEVIAGNTSVIVPHNLPYNPNPSSIMVTPTKNLDGLQFWVSDVGVDTFKINMSGTSPTSEFFAWRAEL